MRGRINARFAQAPSVKGWTVGAQRRQDYRQGRFDSSAREAGARGVNHHYEKQIDLAARFRRVRRWSAMDALDCANFSSERAWRTESSPTDSTYFAVPLSRSRRFLQ